MPRVNCKAPAPHGTGALPLGGPCGLFHGRHGADGALLVHGVMVFPDHAEDLPAVLEVVHLWTVLKLSRLSLENREAVARAIGLLVR